MSFEDILLLEERNKHFIDEIKKNNERIRSIAVEQASNISVLGQFTDILIVDLEHTDRKIIQIAVKSMRIQKTFSSLVNPNCKISSIVRELTGIQQKDCDSAPTFLDIRSKIDEFFNSGPVIVLAHNGRSCDFPILIDALGMKSYEHLWVDTYHDFGSIFNKKLEDIEPSYSLFIDLHNAVADVELLECLIIRHWKSVVHPALQSFIDDRKRLLESSPDYCTVTHLRKVISQYGVSGISGLKKELLINEYKKIIIKE